MKESTGRLTGELTSVLVKPPSGSEEQGSARPWSGDQLMSDEPATRNQLVTRNEQQQLAELLMRLVSAELLCLSLCIVLFCVVYTPCQDFIQQQSFFFLTLDLGTQKRGHCQPFSLFSGPLIQNFISALKRMSKLRDKKAVSRSGGSPPSPHIFIGQATLKLINLMNEADAEEKEGAVGGERLLSPIKVDYGAVSP